MKWKQEINARIADNAARDRLRSGRDIKHDATTSDGYGKLRGQKQGTKEAHERGTTLRRTANRKDLLVSRRPPRCCRP